MIWYTLLTFLWIRLILFCFLLIANIIACFVFGFRVEMVVFNALFSMRIGRNMYLFYCLTVISGASFETQCFHTREGTVLASTYWMHTAKENLSIISSSRKWTNVEKHMNFHGSFQSRLIKFEWFPDGWWAISNILWKWFLIYSLAVWPALLWSAAIRMTQTSRRSESLLQMV